MKIITIAESPTRTVMTTCNEHADALDADDVIELILSAIPGLIREGWLVKDHRSVAQQVQQLLETRLNTEFPAPKEEPCTAKKST